MHVAVMLFVLLAASVRADDVDVELLLLADVPRSMSAGELELQRPGCAEALRSDSVAAALTRTLTGSMALAYVEWAGRNPATRGS